VTTSLPYTALARQIRRWARELGFQQAGITDVDLSRHEPALLEWLQKGYHGEMAYMQRHGTLRARPDELLPGSIRAISVRMHYLPDDRREEWSVLNDDRLAYVSRYALGRDYHKLMRKRLQRLAKQIETVAGPHGYRVFVDSAPILEKPLAQKAGLGWMGKHTNLINRHAGSWFFLGEILTDLPLPCDPPVESDHCGRCRACIDICPTRAIVAPYELDARRCISYLTIELRGAIPVELRPLIGNRIYGCDDCQLVCPWNRFAQQAEIPDFSPRHGLDAANLLALFRWQRDEFLSRMEGSAIRRIGFDGWQRNIAVALGNARHAPEIIQALTERRADASDMVREHIDWAIETQQRKAGNQG